jgi:phage shock protein PspC (stress-responsive transcriptional regulator)
MLRCFIAIKLCVRCGFKTVCSIDHSTVRILVIMFALFTRFNLYILSIAEWESPRSQARHEVAEFCWLLLGK